MFSSLVPKAKAAPSPSRFSEDEIAAAEHYKWWLVFLALKKRQLEGIADLSQPPAPDLPLQEGEPVEPDVDQLLATWIPPATDPAASINDGLLSTWDEPEPITADPMSDDAVSSTSPTPTTDTTPVSIPTDPIDTDTVQKVRYADIEAYRSALQDQAPAAVNTTPTAFQEHELFDPSINPSFETQPQHLAANFEDALPDIDPDVHPAIGLSAASLSDTGNPVS